MQRTTKPSLMLVSRAEFARMSKRSRSSVTEACAGVLKPACVGDRINMAHPAAVAYGLERGVYILKGTLLQKQAPVIVSEAERAKSLISAAAFADEHGLTVSDVERDMADFIVHPWHLSAQQFATRASAGVDDVLIAIGTVLAPAITATRFIDLGHKASLEFLAARPFKRERNGDPICPEIGGGGYLAAAAVGDDGIDVHHPVSLAFLARIHGRVPTAADLGLPAELSHRQLKQLPEHVRSLLEAKS